ncbi:hypothetical protein TYRP_009342 [Tyrophagus putrescentiae]|nr:hypothetical protein TYRP_009342 [Tyrophagus putrescentiae]
MYRSSLVNASRGCLRIAGGIAKKDVSPASNLKLARASCQSKGEGLLLHHHPQQISVCDASSLASSSSSSARAADVCSTKQRSPVGSSSASVRLFSSGGDLPSHIKVTLPALSPTMELGTIVSWEKKEGDKLNEGDLLAEIETDKATMGFETPEEGYLAKILIPAGTKDIPIGKLLCIIVSEQSDVAAFSSYVPTGADLEGAAKAEPPPPQQQASTPSPPPPSAPSAAAAAPSAVAFAAAPSVVTSSLSPSSGLAGRLFASPLAKKLASEKGIDLAALAGQGTGPSGRIRAQDVLTASPARMAAGAAGAGAAASAGAFQDISLTNMRQVIAKRLLMSKQTVPHYYLSVEIQVDELLKARTELNEMLKGDGVKISLNDFVVKAAALACLKVPEVNSSWQESFIRQYTSVDVAIAVSTDAGLITPIVFGAEKKGLVEIANDTKALAKKAREGKLQPAEFQGGSFTISNLGMFGVTNFSAVINPPQSAILAVGGTERRLVPDASGRPVAANVLGVTLSCDHRVVDGAVGATWLKSFKQYLAKPFSMIL